MAQYWTSSDCGSLKQPTVSWAWTAFAVSPGPVVNEDRSYSFYIYGTSVFLFLRIQWPRTRGCIFSKHLLAISVHVSPVTACVGATGKFMLGPSVYHLSTHCILRSSLDSPLISSAKILESNENNSQIYLRNSTFNGFRSIFFLNSYSCQPLFYTFKLRWNNEQCSD